PERLHRDPQRGGDLPVAQPVVVEHLEDGLLERSERVEDRVEAADLLALFRRALLRRVGRRLQSQILDLAAAEASAQLLVADHVERDPDRERLEPGREGAAALVGAEAAAVLLIEPRQQIL